MYEIKKVKPDGPEKSDSPIFWIPACAGMTVRQYHIDSLTVLPAQAGIRSLKRLFTRSSNCALKCRAETVVKLSTD